MPQIIKTQVNPATIKDGITKLLKNYPRKRNRIFSLTVIPKNKSTLCGCVFWSR